MITHTLGLYVYEVWQPLEEQEQVAETLHSMNMVYARHAAS